MNGMALIGLVILVFCLGVLFGMFRGFYRQGLGPADSFRMALDTFTAVLNNLLHPRK